MYENRVKVKINTFAFSEENYISRQCICQYSHKYLDAETNSISHFYTQEYVIVLPAQ